MASVIEVYKPTIKRKDLEYVLGCMVKDKIDNGEFAKNFELRLKERVGVSSVIAIDSFQKTIELVFDALEIKEGDEVMLPSFAPLQYLNVILRRKASPVFYELENDYYEPSISSIRELKTSKTKLLILNYYFGYTYDPTAYIELSPFIVEDITSVLGAKANEMKVGNTGIYSIADFSSRSMITTGEGGAIFCGARKNLSVINSFIEKDYDYENYKPRSFCLMPDLNAAMGVSQDETLNHRLKIKESIAKFFEDALSRSRNSFIQKKEGYDRIYTAFPIIVKSSLKDAIQFLKKAGIESIRPFAYPLHHYMNLPKENYPVTEFYYLNTLLIPIYSSLSNKEVDLIVKALVCMI